jgi:two-component system response regulator CpxR
VQGTPVKKSTKSLTRRILVVDDYEELCHLLREYLAQDGFAVEAVHSGAQGVERALSGDQAVVVLDVMLPDMKGFEVLRRVRAQSRTPILMLTARGDDQDRILGLQMGADDYLPKPFNPRELSARIEAVLRRSSPDPAEVRHGVEEGIVDADLELFNGARVVRRAGKEVDLTAVEFDLLKRFMKSAGLVLSREEMVRAVLGREFSPFDRSMDTHVSNLRKKLGPRSDGSDRIKGVRGIGYIYVLSSPARGGKR